MNDELKTISFSKLFKVFWREKFLISAILILFFCIGIFYAKSSVDEYVSSGKILPEVSGGNSGSLGGIASMVGLGGLNLSSGSSTEAIRPDLYPDLLKSTPFMLAVLKQNVITKENKKIKFEEYYQATFEKKNKLTKNITYPKVDSSIIVISKLDDNRIKNLRSRINSTIDRKSGIIDISAKMPDPVVAAQIAEFSMNYLTKYVKEYRTAKTQKEVDFLQSKVNNARGNYYSVQSQKAAYADAFGETTIRMQSADIRRERINDEYQMSSTFYKELLTQLEEAKLKLQRETPVFQILEPPVVPNYKSEPSRLIIIFSFLLFGLFISMLTALLKGKNYKKILS